MPIFPWQLPTENKWDHLLVMGQNLGSILPSTARDFVLTVAGVLFQLSLGCWAGCAWNEKLRLACARSAPRRTSGVGDERTLAALADNGFPWTAGRETGRNPSMGCWGVVVPGLSRARCWCWMQSSDYFCCLNVTVILPHEFGLYPLASTAWLLLAAGQWRVGHAESLWLMCSSVWLRIFLDLWFFKAKI